MKKLRAKLAIWLVRLASRLAPAPQMLRDTEHSDAVVSTTNVPKWTPRQTGGVVVAEPKLVTIERAQHGNEAMQSMFDEIE